MIQKIRMTDLYDTLLEHEDLQSFSNCLREAGLHLALRMMGPLTILAFTNRALEALPAMIRIMLNTDRDFLTVIMMRHIVRGDWSMQQILEMDHLESLQTDLSRGRFEISKTIQIKDMDWAGTEIPATNGTIHLVNQTVIQPAIQAEMEVLAA